MGGKAPPAEEPKAVEPPKPVPIPDARANADTPSAGAKPSFATQQEAETQDSRDRKGLGGAVRSTVRRATKDPASVANSSAGGGLGSAAVITG